MKHLKTALAALAILGAPAAAQAGVIYYADLASFQAAAGPTSFESFENPITANASVVATADVTVSCATTVNCLDPAFAASTDGLLSIGSYEALTFLFATPVRSFGIDLLGLATAGLPVDFSVQIGGDAPYIVYSNQFRPGDLFAGLVSDTAFSQITVFGSDRADFIGYDSLRYGAGQAVSAAPEPAAWALMILGLGGAGAAMRRRRAAAVAG